MKYLKCLTILLVSLSSIAQAEVYEVSCSVDSKMKRINKFDLVGELHIDVESKFSGFFSGVVRRQGENSREESIYFEASGQIKVIPAGEIAKNQIVYLSSVPKDSNITRLTMASGHPNQFSSALTLGDGFTYKSKCVLE
ncbi:MAG: hypothetical protein CME66_00495 [Halobacteriovoraceae bacterium]|nr:hypothetical protein [Halobacteriovoraceae bacterium]